MPATEVIFYKTADGEAPVLDWLTQLSKRNPKAYKKCRVLIGLLEEQGHELRRPQADLLRDGVYELRASLQGTHHRILYGFVGKNVALLAVGLVKEKAVPSKEIDLAAVRLAQYADNPEAHGFALEEEEDG